MNSSHFVSMSGSSDESPASSILNPSPPGFFPGANNVYANNGVFNDIARDLNIITVEIQVCLNSWSKKIIPNSDTS
jgi:hypothetical protein